MDFTKNKFPWPYLVLSYAIAWAFWIPVALIGVNYQSSPFLIVLVFAGVSGPAIAGIFLTYAEQGKEGGRDFWLRACGTRRVRTVWWAILFLLWPALHLASIGITGLRGGGAPGFEFVRDLVFRPASFLAIVFLYFVQAGIEELGWRGYMLERLQRSKKPLGASLVIGVFHAIWHLPLFFVRGTNQVRWGFGVDFWIFISVAVAASIYLTWCYNQTRRSTFAAAVLHCTANLCLDIFKGPPAQERTYNALMIAGAAAIAAVWLIQGGSTGEKNHTSQEGGGTNE
ncbi:MAG: CPBP family intramembrane metalloprotease [Spirochaetes bacterium]|nr:CPBP family intramembrane metalloprotease [Spirochaetota bacterium]